MQKDRFYRCPHVLSESLSSGEVVLLQVVNGQYFTLNETGSQIWSLLVSGRDIDDAAAEIASTYDVAPQEAFDSIVELAAEMERKSLVVRAA